MTKREEFTRWMLESSNRSKNTINKYAAAVVTISKELTKYNNTIIDIYSINDSMSINMEISFIQRDITKKDELVE